MRGESYEKYRRRNRENRDPPVTGYRLWELSRQPSRRNVVVDGPEFGLWGSTANSRLLQRGHQLVLQDPAGVLHRIEDFDERHPPRGLGPAKWTVPPAGVSSCSRARSFS
jgi:hypothetical protein